MFYRPEISARYSLIGIRHHDGRELLEIMPLSKHLRPNQDAWFAVDDWLDELFKCPSPSGGIPINSNNRDIGKAVSVPNHPGIGAEIVRPYVREDVYHMIRTHQDFQGRHYYHHFNADPDAREKYRDEPWFEITARFADDWDQMAFDPDYDTLPLEHFEPLVRKLTANPHMM